VYKAQWALPEGQHLIVVIYYEAAGDASVRVSFARTGDLPTPTHTITPSPTLTATATPITPTPTSTPTPTLTTEPAPSSVLINEVMPVPKRIDWNDDGTRDEGDAWVELYNPTDEVVDLSFWTLDADRSEQVAYKIPYETVIEPKGYLVLFASETGLDLTKGLLRLVKGTVVLDEVELQRLKPDSSMSRTQDGLWETRLIPTPGAENLVMLLRFLRRR